MCRLARHLTISLPCLASPPRHARRLASHAHLELTYLLQARAAGVGCPSGRCRMPEWTVMMATPGGRQQVHPAFPTLPPPRCLHGSVVSSLHPRCPISPQISTPGTHPPLHPRVTVCTGEAMDEFKQYARGDCGAAGAPCLAHPVGPEMIPRIGVFATPLLVPHTRVSALPESCI